MEERPSDKIARLRARLEKSGVRFIIIPSSDPHLSEYVAGHWKTREWVSGFTGSAGTVAVSTSEAGLWTDSRYFLQAETQLARSGIELFKEGLAETPSITDWIFGRASEGDCVGIDGDRFSAGEVELLERNLTSHGLRLKTDVRFADDLWRDAPPLPVTEAFYLDEEFSGMSLKEKLSLVRSETKKENADALLVAALDEVAWLFNLRASDVEFNPVAIAYGIVCEDAATLFTDGRRIPPETQRILSEANVATAPYQQVREALASLPGHIRMMVDKEKTNHTLATLAGKRGNSVFRPSPITKMKSIKNKTEIEGVRKAVVKDGAAMATAFRWLEESISNGVRVTERGFAEKLRECRARQEGFFCESFGTIAGYGGHGAIVHYFATPESDAPIGTDNLLLVDSGGNYLEGTTDITRTIIIGKPTEQQKRDYTNVLKGHIALASIQFPKGTHGSQLDVLARQFLWNSGEDYGHGTGHGIGHFLCVHEGPQNIRTRDNGTALQKGMLISNEPGVYKTGQYGIRTENMVLVIEGARNDAFGEFLQFETLSLFPFDSKLIETSMLDAQERLWINQYHEKVFEAVAPMLDQETKEWLRLKVKTI